MEVPKPPYAESDDIENVSVTTQELIKRYCIAHPTPVALGLLVYIILNVLVSNIQFTLISFVLIIGGIAGVLQSQVHERFMRQFATRNGFHYEKTGFLFSENGIIFDRGHSKHSSNFVSGELDERPFRLFNYEYTVGRGKNSHMYTHTIIDLAIANTLPRIYLDAHKNEQIVGIFGNSYNFEHLSLESNDFNRRFALYVERGAHINALEVFTPDVMQFLLSLQQHYDIEIADGQLYIYATGYIYSKDRIEELLSITRRIASKIANVLERLEKNDTLAMMK